MGRVSASELDFEMTVLSRSKNAASTGGNRKLAVLLPGPDGRRGGGAMDVCLMIEGQEGVTWDDWVALALACEEHGFAGLFRSDHYLSFGHPTERGSLGAWATLAALGGRT